MVPTGIGTLLVLLAFVPGWLYLRLLSRLRPPARSSSLDELLEVVAVGVATTGVSAMVVALLPRGWLPFILDLDAWATQGDAYLQKHVRVAAATLAVVLFIALAIAYLLYLWQRRARPGEFHPQGNVWIHALGSRPKGKVPWLGLQLADGRLVEGILHSFSIDDIGDDRDIALSKPIRVTDPQKTTPYFLTHDRLVVPSREIKHIVVFHAPEKES